MPERIVTAYSGEFAKAGGCVATEGGVNCGDIMRTFLSMLAAVAALIAADVQVNLAQAGERGMASYYGYRSKTASVTASA